MTTLIIITLLYFVPTIVAAARHTTNRRSVAVINIFLGWTFIGWIVALAMSGSGRLDKPTAALTAPVANASLAASTTETDWYIRPWVLEFLKGKEILGSAVAIVITLCIVGIIYGMYRMPNHNGIAPTAKEIADKEVVDNKAAKERAATLDVHEKNMLRVALIENILRDSMRNPDSFKMDSAIVPLSGAVCMEYRAQNGFGGMNNETAVVTPASKLFVQGTDSGFYKAWNKYCHGKSGDRLR
jgi:T4 superinfection immunity protein